MDKEILKYGKVKLKIYYLTSKELFDNIAAVLIHLKKYDAKLLL